MMKKLFLAFIFLTASGCTLFSNKSDTTTNSHNEIPENSKTIANKYAVITIPENWVVLKTPSSTPQLILMEHFPMTANLIDGDNFNSNTTKKLFEMIQNEFPNAKLAEEIKEKKLVFSAQKNNQSDRYIFQQNILELPKDKYLLASCSYPVDYPENNCDDFFNAIKIR